MYELNQIGKNTYYFSGPTKIGLYRLNETNVCLIDTGIDEGVGKRILKTVEANGWKIDFVINTHAHADHVGGNAYIQEHTGCRIYANTIEACFTENTFLNTCFVYGANSPKELRKKFMLAEKSKVAPIKTAELPEGMEIIDLKGHSSEMIGVRTPDDILFLADSLASEQVIDKYRITYIFNVEDYLDTLYHILDLKAKLFVPAHADVTDDITLLAQINIKATKKIADFLLSAVKEPISFERLLKIVFDAYQLKINHEEYALIGSTIKSYLTYLSDLDLIQTYFENNILMICAC